jgi:anti-sigma regulatory factor (Ser/Thr protein kinase)
MHLRPGPGSQRPLTPAGEREARVSERNSLTLRLPARAGTAAEVRRTLHDLCHHAPDHRLYDAELLTSEIVTNAVKHAGGILTIVMECDQETLAVAVSDDSPDVPVVRDFCPEGIGGRGMRLVAHLAAAWGCTPTPDGNGKVVWFRLAL